MKKVKRSLSLSQSHSIYIFTRKAFVTIFPFSVVWSMFNDRFDGVRRTASSVPTLRENWRSLQRLMLPFARQMTFWVLPDHVYEAVKAFSLFLKCSLSIKDFPREAVKGTVKVSMCPKGHGPGCSSLPPVSGRRCCAPFTPDLWRAATAHKNEGLCPFLVSCLLREPAFLKLISASFAHDCFGLAPCFLGSPLGCWVTPAARAEASRGVRSAVQPLSAKDRAPKQSIYLRRWKILFPLPQRDSMV